MLANDPAVVRYLETVVFTLGLYTVERETADMIDPRSPHRAPARARAERAVERARQAYADAVAEDLHLHGTRASW